MHLPYTRPGHLLRLAPALALVLAPLGALAQGPALGLRAVGGLSLGVAASTIDHGARGTEATLALDLGHFASRRVRLGASASFLRTLPLEEYVPQDDATYRDVFYDLAGHVSLSFLARSPDRRLVPYASFGAGVHVLTSTFGSIPIDIRYNTNVFGLRSGLGLRWRGRTRAVSVEAGAVLAKNVSRASLGVTTDWLLGDLRQRSP